VPECHKSIHCEYAHPNHWPHDCIHSVVRLNTALKEKKRKAQKIDTNQENRRLYWTQKKNQCTG